MSEINGEAIAIGFDLGVYVLGCAVAEGIIITPEGWKSLTAYSAASIEKATGVPAEDLAMSVQPIVDRLLGTIKK